MASANEYCCINDFLFQKQSMLIEGIIAHYISRIHEGRQTFKGLFGRYWRAAHQVLPTFIYDRWILLQNRG